MTPPIIFICLTFALWIIGVLRMGYRRHEHRLNSFFLGMTVMSFAAIWISALGQQ